MCCFLLGFQNLAQFMHVGNEHEQWRCRARFEKSQRQWPKLEITQAPILETLLFPMGLHVTSSLTLDIVGLVRKFQGDGDVDVTG